MVCKCCLFEGLIFLDIDMKWRNKSDLNLCVLMQIFCCSKICYFLFVCLIAATAAYNDDNLMRFIDQDHFWIWIWLNKLTGKKQIKTKAEKNKIFFEINHWSWYKCGVYSYVFHLNLKLNTEKVTHKNKQRWI